MAENTHRASGVPGLLIWGCQSYGFSIGSDKGDGFSLSVAPQARVGAVRLNHFTRVRDAKAAAQRLADQVDLPWHDHAELMAAIEATRHDGDCWRALRNDIAEALLGRPIAEVEAEHREEQERIRYRESGEELRDRLEARAHERGHRVTLVHYGVKSFKGTCSGCGELFKVAAAPYGGHAPTYPRGGEQVSPDYLGVGPCSGPAGESSKVETASTGQEG